MNTELVMIVMQLQ